MAKRHANFRSWHHTKAGETVAALWHGLWAIVCLAQGILSVSYAWFCYGIIRFMDSPAAQALFWLCISSAVFGLGGAIWHLASGLAHNAARRARRGRHVV